MELAKSLMEKAEAKGVRFLLPEDVVVADKASCRRAHNTYTALAHAELAVVVFYIVFAASGVEL